MFVGLASSVASQLRTAFADRRDTYGETQQDIAERLSVSRSVINRRLRSGSNLTLETIADMAWALGRGVKVEIFDPAEKTGCNERIYFSEHASVPLPFEFEVQAHVIDLRAQRPGVAAKNRPQVEFKTKNLVDS